ncbi:MAG TPA: hypothetical protein VG675_08400 [Bryobacteraceae bacterium]|nr:hypothetical protein [Bryobacteraceae bacterium]
MAGSALAPKTSALTINIFDGSRQPLTAGNVLMTIADGAGKQLVRDEYPSGTTFSVPFYDNFGDRYTVLAYRDGYEQAGFTPVSCSPGQPQTVDIMLLKKDAAFNFASARWELLRQTRSQLSSLLAHGAASDAAARDRYSQLMENHAASLACLFNITTTMEAIHLPTGTPLDYFKEIIWDDTLQQDRFYAWADPALYDQVKAAAAQCLFAREVGFAAFHHGATDSYKQIQFGEANLQLTFHANDTREIDGKTCIRMEPDIDYFKDLGAHALLEVIHNGITGTLTDPRQVYVLRWIAGRHAGVPNFNPPYVIV